jgi:hypothetical protein
MATTRVKGLDGLMAALERDLPKLRLAVSRSAAVAARETAHHVAQHVPIAFAELRASIHADVRGLESGKVSCVADAPHAAAVEKGSRPHWVPLEPLVRWVKLRGMQGLRRGRLPGTTSREQADRVAGRLASAAAGGHSGVDAPLSIARAIQVAIARRGTRPHFYMRSALPVAMRALDAAVKAKLHRDGGA